MARLFVTLALTLLLPAGIMAKAPEPSIKSANTSSPLASKRALRSPCMTALSLKGLAKPMRKKVTRAAGAIAKARKTCRLVLNQLEAPTNSTPRKARPRFNKGRTAKRARPGRVCSEATRAAQRSGATEEQKKVRLALRSIRRERAQCRQVLTAVEGSPPAQP